MGNLFSISISSDNALSRCLDYIARRQNYAFQLEKNLDILRNDWDKLKSIRIDIERKIEVAERDPRMKRLEVVVRWLERVEAMEAEVEKVIRDGSQESLNKCLGGSCPKNYITNYKLGKNLVRKQREVVDLKKGGSFEVVTDRVAIPQNDERPAERTSGLESTFDEVWSYIEDDQVGIMGIYGMGGVGKTTLLNQINNDICKSTPGFDAVIWIVVSKTPNLTKVQDDIGEKIGFYGDEWKNKSQEKKAVDIFSVLKKKKYVLLLDDMWERIDLKDLGVPLPDQSNKSKVILTTRSKEVCGLMEAHKRIQVKCLGEEEAFDLFKNKVGEVALNAHPEIPKLAKEVAKECGGLPLALITIGRTMACKTTTEEWRNAIALLKSYASKFSGIEEKVFSRLRFSYESLPNATIRSCFLYCSLYPEDEEISKKELIDKWICEGFLDKFDDLHKARNEGHDSIGTLVHASLLEECSFGRVKMHDVIRDMAIWIGCECGTMNDKFFVQAGVGLTKTPIVAKWEGAERMSLMDNKIEELTGTPQCPKLLTLFLNGNRPHLMIITSGFFQSMPNLRVLDLSGNFGLTRIPWEIGELVSLQYLNLSSTGIEELPIEFQNLIKLKYLNLENTGIHKIAEGVLSSFKELQILYLSNRGDVVPKTYVQELESLEYLSDLTIAIRSDFALLEFTHSCKLTSITTRLQMWGFEGPRYLDVLSLKEMIRLERLDISRLESLEEIIIGKEKATSSSRIIINQNCFSNSSLRFVWISYCPMLKDVTWLLAFAPNLEQITISNCAKMKTMVGGGWEWDENAAVEGGRPHLPFAKLTRLSLGNLPELERICLSALPFPCLKYMWAYQCPKLKKLPFNSSSCRSGCGITTIKGEEEWWNGLEWEDEATRLAFLPSLKPLPTVS